MKFWVCQDKKLIDKDMAGYDNVLVTSLNEKYLPQNTQMSTENSVTICVFCGKKTSLFPIPLKTFRAIINDPTLIQHGDQ